MEHISHIDAFVDHVEREVGHMIIDVASGYIPDLMYRAVYIDHKRGMTRRTSNHPNRLGCYAEVLAELGDSVRPRLDGAA